MSIEKYELFRRGELLAREFDRLARASEAQTNHFDPSGPGFLVSHGGMVAQFADVPSGGDGSSVSYTNNSTVTTDQTSTLQIGGPVIIPPNPVTFTTAIVNDFVIPAGSDWLRVSTPQPTTLNGVAAGSNGQLLTITNVGPSTLKIPNQSAANTNSSSQFLTANSDDVTLKTNQSMQFIYDTTSSVWRELFRDLGDKGGTVTSIVAGTGLTGGTITSTGTVALSIPVAISSGGTNSTTALNNSRIMVSSGGAVVESAALTNGQLLIGSTGAAPVAATITAGSNITVTNAAGSITIASSVSAGSSNLFTQTATVTVANSNAQTSIVGAGQGSMTLGANSLSVGTTLLLTVWGDITADGTDTLTATVTLGGTTVGTLSTTPPASATQFKIELYMTCRTTGAAGTVFTEGFAIYYGNSIANSVSVALASLGSHTINTTISNLVDVLMQWGTALPGDSVSGTIIVLGQLR